MAESGYNPTLRREVGGRGRETGRALTEVRTVLSRAETALADLSAGPSEGRFDPVTREFTRYPDPEQDEMEEALRQVVVLLARWRRTGRKKYADGEYR